jgi:hypothetical protein
LGESGPAKKPTKTPKEKKICHDCGIGVLGESGPARRPTKKPNEKKICHDCRMIGINNAQFFFLPETM